MKNFGLVLLWCFLGFFGVSCKELGFNKTSETNYVPTPEPPRKVTDIGGADGNYKVPLAPGFNWEVSQSWAEHCEECNRRYPDWDYCTLSHTGDCCHHGLDFNLPGDADLGKPVLATGDGKVRSAGYDAGWGYNVVIEHTGNICSRYGHMMEDSIVVDEGQEVCQGLKLGKIGNTGSSEGAHLHFQFENCDSGKGLAMGFTDGNGVPMCTRGNDVFDDDGNYNFLNLTNSPRESCGEEDNVISGGGELPQGGWLRATCGTLPGCPLVTTCGRGFDHEFSDQQYLDAEVEKASLYLWSECSLDGKEDGGVHQYDFITRAESLKISMYLFGLMEGCGVAEPFRDVDPEDWYFPIIACAVRYRLVDHGAALFYPNREVTYAEAAKLVVGPAVVSGVIEAAGAGGGHFRHFPANHWANSYMETLYTYGGILRDADEIHPEDPVSRREYIMMAAALSPCFCGNVRCERSCGTCDQETYSCVNPDDSRPGVGGEDVKPEEDPDPTRDPETAGEVHISVQDQDAGVSQRVPDAGVNQPPEPDAERPPQLIIPGLPDAGPPVDAAVPDARVPAVPPQDRSCIGYEIDLWAIGGWLEAQTSGVHAGYTVYQFEDDEHAVVTLFCDELPAMILLHSGFDEATAARVEDPYGSFEAWAPYRGELTFNVGDNEAYHMPATRRVHVFEGEGSSDNNILIRTPSMR